MEIKIICRNRKSRETRYPFKVSLRIRIAQIRIRFLDYAQTWSLEKKKYIFFSQKLLTQSTHSLQCHHLADATTATHP